MAFNSFYAGRQGASFVIVARFDGVSIEPNTVPQVKCYAINEDGLFIYPFVEKDERNFSDYVWKAVELNGALVAVEDGSEQELPEEYQEGMVQCFKQGGDTVDIVNYGEYVIIDTASKDNPENGKVYRRGLDYMNELGGAEYIGQIVGPRGETPDWEIDNYEDVPEPRRADVYNVLNHGLVPGADDAEENFNDDIKYIWATVRDDYGNVSSYRVGFIFPYAVEHAIARVRSPYTDGVPLPADEELIERIDDQSHPYFRKWRFNIPHGIKGDTQTEFAVYPYKVAAESKVYTQVDPDTGMLSGLLPDRLAEDTEIIIETYFNTAPKGYVEFMLDGTKVYAMTKECKDYHFGYLQTWYDEHEVGDWEWKDVGKYKVIDSVELSETGVMRVLYTCDEPDVMSQVLRWIYFDQYDKESGLRIADDGTVTLWYNTVDVDGFRQKDVNEERIPWVVKMTLNPDSGVFKVFFNNDQVKDAIETAGGEWDDADNAYMTQFAWVKDAEVAEDGTITFKRTDGSEFDVSNKIKWITDVEIDTGDVEGAGTQKLNVTYNDGSMDEIGNAINYIVESVVTDVNDWGAPVHHLLVYYADPDMRAMPGIQTYTYQGLKDEDPKGGWIDLGYVKGEPGGVHIIGNVSSVDNLYKDGADRTDPWLPEEIGGGWSSTAPDMDFEGWIMTVQAGAAADPVLYAFDYQKNIWYSLGTISGSLIDPTAVIVASKTQPITLNTGGYWALVVDRVSV